ncbi:PP2C family protein-serine/threonine phosphatase [Amycolatopsis azurea]|uniref:Serine/threonine protein phosphatase n=1 Tax=Amycolatopsis azurea DSM 43854 TaxID=1238180 RepID=A0ABX3JDM7_9PSEU|nr:PP2C family protein-serine/threonine phosphatase [Amycolatopsis azurea]OOC05805.1 serine/threonine protein phosphatase [Amycolatopsis azurea DSM 43854]
MTEPVIAAPASTGRSWETAPSPALVVDIDGVVRDLNDAARAMFPEVRPGLPLRHGTPAWLAEARTDGIVRGVVGDRAWAASPVPHDGVVTWWLADESDAEAAHELLRRERRRVAFLTDASAALLSSLNVERCIEVAARLAAEHLAGAAVVLAPPVQGGHPAASCVRGEAVTLSRLKIDPADLPGLDEALRGFPPVPSRWLDPGTAPSWILPAGFGPATSIVVTPLPGHGVPAGALILLRTGDQAAFTEQEEIFARLFAARAGAAISAARMFAHQASTSETLMRELLPPRLEQLGGVEFAGRYRPAQDEDRIGGDFYDVHSAVDTAGGESLAVLGDVCGKGLDAAVLTGKIRTTLRALLPMAEDHHRLLSLLNTSLVSRDDGRFVTLALASARRDGDAVRLRVTCAGHPPPLVVRSDGIVEEVDTGGNLIGVLPEIRTSTEEVLLAPGESCLMYTDGIVEAKGGPLGDEMFGEERLHTALSECADLAADAVAEHVQMLAAQWVGPRPHDDMAVLVITAPRSPRRPGTP